MPRPHLTAVLPGPRGPRPGMDEPPAAHAAPNLRTFLRSRFISANGVAAALYLALSLWILRNPERGRRIWQRLQGLDS